MKNILERVFSILPSHAKHASPVPKEAPHQYPGMTGHHGTETIFLNDSWSTLPTVPSDPPSPSSIFGFNPPSPFAPTYVQSHNLPSGLTVADSIADSFISQQLSVQSVAYPEWRTEITKKARRAGMGDINQAMEDILFTQTRWKPSNELLSLEYVKNDSTSHFGYDELLTGSGAPTIIDNADMESEYEWVNWEEQGVEGGLASKKSRLPSVYGT
jgi:hypothetical protein